MAISRLERGFAIRTAGVLLGFWGMFFGACKGSGLGRFDGAVDAPQAGAGTTGTGSLNGTGTVASTGGPTTTSTGTVSSTMTVTPSESASATGWRTGTGTATTTTTVTATATSSTSTSAQTVTSTSTSTWTGVGTTWKQVKVSRTNGLGFCPVDGTAASVVVKRADDGSLILSGEAFRAAPGETTGCLSSSGVCTKKQAFPEMVLTQAQRDRLESLVNAMPPGKCTSKGNVDPCILTTLSIDNVSDTDWGSWGCVEDGGPGTHLAGERAIVAYIDSLVPGTVPVRVDASVGDAAKDSTVFPIERQTGPCDIYADAKMPCAAAYSTIRALSKSYNGPLFQVRAGSTSNNNTMSGGTTKDIMPGPDGFVDASMVDEACGNKGYCTVSVLYDHSGNGNHLVRAPKGNTVGGATGAVDDFESIATKGRVLVGGHQVYSLYMNKLEGYRTQVGVVGANMPTGSQPQGLYMLADGTRNATACCWEFGNVTTKPATEWAFADALVLGNTTWVKGAGEGPWFLFDFGDGVWAGGSRDGDPGTPNETPSWGIEPPLPKGNLKNPSLSRVRFALGFLKVMSSEYAIRVADLSTANELVTAYQGKVPVTVNHKGGIVLGVGADNSNNSWGTFYEGAIVAGYPSNTVELSVMKNLKAVGYAAVP